jgi:hypothetical protein
MSKHGKNQQWVVLSFFQTTRKKPMLGGSSLFQTEKNQWVKVEYTDP